MSLLLGLWAYLYLSTSLEYSHVPAKTCMLPTCAAFRVRSTPHTLKLHGWRGGMSSGLQSLHFHLTTFLVRPQLGWLLPTLTAVFELPRVEAVEVSLPSASISASFPVPSIKSRHLRRRDARHLPVWGSFTFWTPGRPGRPSSLMDL